MSVRIDDWTVQELYAEIDRVSPYRVAYHRSDIYRFCIDAIPGHGYDRLDCRLYQEHGDSYVYAVLRDGVTMHTIKKLYVWLSNDAYTMHDLAVRFNEDLTNQLKNIGYLDDEGNGGQSE